MKSWSKKPTLWLKNMRLLFHDVSREICLLWHLKKLSPPKRNIKRLKICTWEWIWGHLWRLLQSIRKEIQVKQIRQKGCFHQKKIEEKSRKVTRMKLEFLKATDEKMWVWAWKMLNIPKELIMFWMKTWMNMTGILKRHLNFISEIMDSVKKWNTHQT